MLTARVKPWASSLFQLPACPGDRVADLATMPSATRFARWPTNGAIIAVAVLVSEPKSLANRRFICDALNRLPHEVALRSNIRSTILRPLVVSRDIPATSASASSGV